jgi:hypothetical protein
MAASSGNASPSQSFKAALRDNLTLVRTQASGEVAGDSMKDLATRLGLDMSVRSALIGDRKVKPAMVERSFSEQDATEWSDAVMGLWRREGATVDADTPIVVGEKEIAGLADACAALRKAKHQPADLRELIDIHENWVRQQKLLAKLSKACGRCTAIPAWMARCLAVSQRVSR